MHEAVRGDDWLDTLQDAVQTSGILFLPTPFYTANVQHQLAPKPFERRLQGELVILGAEHTLDGRPLHLTSSSLTSIWLSYRV